MCDEVIHLAFTPHTHPPTCLSTDYPHPGWHEQDPQDWVAKIDICIEQAVLQLQSLGHRTSDIKAVGITNQRETTVVWDKVSGQICQSLHQLGFSSPIPFRRSSASFSSHTLVHRAIAWPDVRTTPLVHHLSAKKSVFGSGVDQLRAKTGLPISNYFAAVKLRWLTDHCDAVRNALAEDRLMVGTVDTYLLWVRPIAFSPPSEPLPLAHGFKSHWVHIALYRRPERWTLCHRCHQCFSYHAHGRQDPTVVP